MKKMTKCPTKISYFSNFLYFRQALISAIVKNDNPQPYLFDKYNYI